jgi:hypothetical protein
MLLVQSGDNFERRARYPFCQYKVMYISKNEQTRHTRQNFGSRRENAEHCPPTRTHVLDTSLDHLLKALQYLQRRQGVNQAFSLINVSSKFTISRISGFALCVMVYSKGLKKSFWNLKCGNSSFSRKRIASCRKESRAKNPTWGLLWQQTCDSVGTKDKHSNSG